MPRPSRHSVVDVEPLGIWDILLPRDAHNSTLLLSVALRNVQFREEHQNAHRQADEENVENGLHVAERECLRLLGLRLSAEASLSDDRILERVVPLVQDSFELTSENYSNKDENAWITRFE